MRKTASITAVLVLAALLFLASGCSDVPEKELAFRNSFKKIWDKAMAGTETARKTIDKAYENGDIATAVSEYKKLGKMYAAAREDLRALDEPPGYGNIKKLGMSYFNEGAAFYTTTASVIENSGGNYSSEQEDSLKKREKEWNKTADRLTTALKAKRIQLK